MKILIYNRDKLSKLTITKNTILLVHNSDFNLFKSYLKGMKVIPLKVYKISNYICGYEELFAYYLKFKIYKYHDFKPTLKILTNWNNFLVLYNQRRYSCALTYLENIENIDIYLNTNDLKLNLKKFLKNVKLNILEQGIFLKKTFTQRKQDDTWINTDFNYFDKINQLTFNPEWNVFNNYIQNYTNLLFLHTIVDDLARKLFVLSLIYYKLALDYLDSNQYTISYIFLHRSFDCFLQYKCRSISNSLILSPAGKLQYNPLPIREKRMVVISNSVDFLSTNHGISFPTTTIDNFNKNRNKLYFAHGQYSIPKSELKKFFKEIRNIIHTIDGTNWSNLFRTISFSHKLKPLDLFMYEPSFNTYLQDKTNQFL